MPLLEVLTLSGLAVMAGGLVWILVPRHLHVHLRKRKI